MFYSVDGQIVQVSGAFPEKKVNTLTFQTRESSFPRRFANQNKIEFKTYSDQSFTINYGDGTILSKKSINGKFGVFYTEDGDEFIPSNYLPPHDFIDTENNGNLRNITFEFENLKDIYQVDLITTLYGFLPKELSEASLKTLAIKSTTQLINFPEELASLPFLEKLLISNAFVSPLLKIPDSVLDSNIKSFTGNGSFDLSDKISSNFFKINQLSNTLTLLQLNGCNITELPEEISSLKKVSNLQFAGGNVRIINPEVIEPLKNIITLRLAFDESINYMIDATNFNSVTSILFTYRTSLTYNDLPLKWKGFKSLIQLTAFGNIVNDNNNNFDNFINNFYTLSITEGFLDPNSNEAIATGFPNQFRDVSWGVGNLTQTGKIQAPAGFVQSIDNGTPTNQGEKIYVLVNNYGHNITTSGNFN